LAGNQIYILISPKKFHQDNRIEVTMCLEQMFVVNFMHYRKIHCGKPGVCPVLKHTVHTAIFFAVCRNGKAYTATRHRQSRPLPCVIYRVHGKGFAVCKSRPTAKKIRCPGMMTWPELCRVPWLLHTAKIGSFAVCHSFCTRQRFQIQFCLFVDYVYGTPSISYIYNKHL